MKKYRVLIWGTGNWSKAVSLKIADKCIIEAYIESQKTKECFNGVKVYNRESFADLYSSTDLTLIAVYDSQEIIDYIESIGLKENVFVLHNIFECSSLKNHKYIENIELLFNVSYRSASNELMNTDYVVCKCDDVNFLVNKKYGMMIRELCCKNANYQSKDMELFVKLVKKYYGISSDTYGYLLDIGANIGTSSIWMKKKLLPNSKVIGFEPVRENCKIYSINCILNGIPDDEWDIVNAAVSDINGTCECMLDGTGNMGDNRISKNGNTIKEREIEIVESITIDSYLRKNYISMDDIKFVWMDVQAHEAFVIQGGNELFSKKVPLYMEFWPEQLRKNNSIKLLMELLKKYYSKYIVINSDCMVEQLEEHNICELEELAKKMVNNSFCDLFLIK